MEWKPIESAPRDGTHVIVRGKLWPEVGPELPVAAVEANWDGREWKPVAQTYYSLGVDAAHWVPLPAPPQ